MIDETYIDSLTAAGISIFSLEDYEAQAGRETERRRQLRTDLKARIDQLARQRREALRRRVLSLTASAVEDDDSSLLHMAESLAPALQATLTAFLQGDHAPESWTVALTEVLTGPLHADLEEVSSGWFLTRQDWPVTEEADLGRAISQTIAASDPLRVALLEAAGRPDALSLKRVVALARGLAEHARNVLERELLSRAGE